MTKNFSDDLVRMTWWLVLGLGVLTTFNSARVFAQEPMTCFQMVAISDTCKNSNSNVSKSLEVESERYLKIFQQLNAKESYLSRSKLKIESGDYVAQSDSWGNVRINPDTFKNLSDDVIAFVIAHEIGHIQLHHFQGGMSAIRAPYKTYPREYDADAFAAKLMAESGYDLDKALVDFQKISGGFSRTHPSDAARIMALQTGQRQIPTVGIYIHN